MPSQLRNASERQVWASSWNGPWPRMGLDSRLAWVPGPTQWHSGAELRANQVESAPPADFVPPWSAGAGSETPSISHCLFPWARERIQKAKRNGGISGDTEEHCCLQHVGPDTSSCTKYRENHAVEWPSARKLRGRGNLHGQAGPAPGDIRQSPLATSTHIATAWTQLAQGVLTHHLSTWQIPRSFKCRNKTCHKPKAFPHHTSIESLDKMVCRKQNKF